MAQLLHSYHSASMVQRYSKRHVRLLRQKKGTEAFIAEIEPKIEVLIQRRDEKKAALEEQMQAYDLVVYFNILLADHIRDLSGDCQRYDRKSLVSPIYSDIFPENSTACVIKAPLLDAPDAADLLKLRIHFLGADHPLFNYVDILDAAIEECRDAIREYNQKVDHHHLVSSTVTIAKNRLIRQYEINYLDLAKMFGKNIADRFFPAITKVKAKKTEKDDQTQKSITPT